MKILIISDLHGNIANLKLVLGFAKKIKADGIIHCGDWDNLQAVDEVLQSRIPLYAVLGNADVRQDVIQKLKLKSQKFDESFLKFEIGGRKIGVVHNLTISHQPLVVGCDVVFSGHKHFKSEKVVNGVKIVQPGALHSVEPSFVVYDTATNGVEFLDL